MLRIYLPSCFGFLLAFTHLNSFNLTAEDIGDFPNMGFSSLMTAIDECKSFDELEKILKADPLQINQSSLLGVLPLHFAARKQGLDLIQWMREKGSAIRSKDMRGQHLFHQMVFQASFPMVDADFLLHIVPPAFFEIESWYDENRPLEDRFKVVFKYLLNAGFIDTQSSLHFDSPDEMGLSPLMMAAALGHLELVKYLVDLGANIHALSRGGMNALLYAIEYRHPQIVEFLISRGAEWDQVDQLNEGPYHKVFKQSLLDRDFRGEGSRDEIFFKLADRAANPTIQDLKTGMNALHLVCARGDYRKARYLIQNLGSNPHQLTSTVDKKNCLNFAIENGNQELIDYLIHLKPTTHHQPHPAGQTMENSPLVGAIKKGDVLTAIKLIESGVDLEPENSGLSVLNMAASYNRFELLPILIEGGANINAIKSGGETALSTCLRAGSQESFETLLQMGANPNVFWNPEPPPLILAYQYGYEWAFDELLNHERVDLNATDSEGRNLVHLMVIARDSESLKKLLAAVTNSSGRSMSWNQKDQKGMTPLHLAVMNQDLETVHFLGDRGASPWTNNREGLSPRELAIKTGARDIFEYLTLLESRVQPSSYEDFEHAPQ